MVKGVLLCGGTGTRLFPFTKAVNKHLIPIGRKCMVEYPLQTLLTAGITDILVVTGGDHLGSFLEYLGSGKSFGCNITYRVQDGPSGIADAIKYAEDFVKPYDKFVVVLGDNYIEEDITPFVNRWIGLDGAMCLVKKDDRWKSFGVAEINNEKIVKIFEKPTTFVSDSVVIGCYMLDKTCFDMISTLKPSGRGELEITDVLNKYIEDGKLYYSKLTKHWTDMGTHESREGLEKYLKP